MPRHKAPLGSQGPNGNNAPNRRSGQGSGSALQEMLKRQAQNPRPSQPPAGKGEPPRGPRKRVV